MGALAFCVAGVVSAQSAEPAKVMGVYYEAYKWGATKITDVPSEFNVIFLFNAAPDGPPVRGSYNNVGNGAFVFKEGYMSRYGYQNMAPGQGNASVAPALVQRVRARGQKVLLTVGGAGNGFNFDNREKSQNFVNSFIAMNAYFLGEGGSPTAGRGLDGVDFNNFESGIGSSSAEMVWIAQRLKALYGPSFMITAPPSGATDYGWIDTNIGRDLNAAGLLSFFSPQIYDDPARYSTAEKIALEINRWISPAPRGYVAAANPPNQFGIGDASKIVIGLPAPSYAQPSGYPLSRATAAYDLVKARHPSLRGVFAWNFHEIQRSNKSFEAAFGPRVFGSSGPAPVTAPAAGVAAPAQVTAPVAGAAGATGCATEAWSGSRRYLPGETVNRLGVSYVALPVSASTWNVNSAPEWSPNYWGLRPCGEAAPAQAPAQAQAPDPSVSAEPTQAPVAASCTREPWVASKRYLPGDNVARYEKNYVALPISATSWNVNSEPESTRNYWELVSC